MALKRSAKQEVKDDKIIDRIGVVKKPGRKAEPEDVAETVRVLPYRAGYESVDRNAIQKALAKGNLSGVVSTSALELGIDIGDIDLIVLLNQPPSLKAFWQRVGRGGRKRPGVCLLIDNRGTIADNPQGLRKYLEAPLEQCWLYLQNRYIQYINALCAAREYRDAVYYYMGRPYRVKRFHYRRGAILVDKEKYYTTRPETMPMAFSSFETGMLKLFQSDASFIAESELMISERVTGFIEQRGPAKIAHEYGPLSPFYRRELNRNFDTTGVCWWFPVEHSNSAATALRIYEAFCFKYGVQQRDLGMGPFHARISPIGIEKCRGMCIFDATEGSLRLTERLADCFGDILEEALLFARRQKDASAVHELETFAGFVRDLRPQSLEGSREIEHNDENGSIIIAAGQTAIHESAQGPMQVVVLEHQFTPHGLLYEIKPFTEKKNEDATSSHARRVTASKRLSQKSGVRWLVAADTVRPIPDETKMVRVNLNTGKLKPL